MRANRAEPQVVVLLDDGPLILVETRDLTTMALPSMRPTQIN